MTWNSSVRPLFHPLTRQAGKRRRRRGALPLVEALETRLTPSAGEIHGTVWNDLNGNGLHDGNELGIAGRTVYLDQNGNDRLDPGEISTTTAADGSYAFTNLNPGTYLVAEVLPDGWQQSSPAAATEWPITLAAQQQTTITFNNFASSATQLIGPYNESGYLFDTTMTNSSTKFRIFGSSDGGYYQGAPALSSQWAPVTISLKRAYDTTPFALTSMDLSGYTVGTGGTVTFTGTRTDGTTVQQTNVINAQPGFQTFTFANFTNLSQVTWGFTGSSPSDYHQFRNVVLQTGSAPIVNGVNFDTVALALPSLSISDAQVQEGNSGTSYGSFTVQLNQQNPYPVTVHYATADGTAKAGIDYGAVSGTVTIGANQRYRSVQVPIYGNTLIEPDKTFTLQLLNPTNGTLARDTGTGTILNDDPLQANNDAYSVNENNVLTVAASGVLANDTPASGGGPLSAQRYAASPAHGTLTLNSDGSFTYTPQTNFYGTDSFQYRDLEGSLVSNVATVTITVNHVNQPPVANNDSYSIDEDHTLTVSAAPGVTSLTMNSQTGDYIGQGKTYGYTPASGTFTVSRNYDNGVSLNYQSSLSTGDWWYLDFAAPGKATLVPGYYGNAARYPFQSANQPGLDVSGQGRGSNTLTGNFTVTQAVYAPDGSVVSFDASFEQHSEGMTPALFGEIQYNTGATPSGVLANDTDPDHDPLTAILVSGPAHGTLALNANGTFTYTPNPNFNGIDTFTYLANDGQLNSNVATVTITVNPINDAPSFAGSGDVAVPENAGPQTITGWARNLSAGPPDEAGQTLTFQVSNDNNALFAVQPSIDPSTGNLTFAAAGDAIGSATVTVLLHDNGGTANGGMDTSAPQTFHIFVNNVPPTFTAPTDQASNEGASQSFALGNFSDPGAGPWSVSVNWGDGSTSTTFSATATGTLPAQTHTYADNGTYTATVTVTDNYQASTSGTFQVAVANVNPVLTAPAAQTASEGSSTSFALGSFTDPGPDAPWSVAVNWGDGSVPTTFTLSAAGTIPSQLHTYADSGTYTVTVSVTDKDQGVGSQTFTVSVANVAPTVTFGGPTTGVRGQIRSFSGSFTDPGADTWTATANYGDGTGNQPLTLNADKTFNFSRAYQTVGTYTITVVVTDNDGGTGTFSQTVTIKAVDVQPDPLNAGRTVLMVAGTSGNDTILINPGSSAGQYKVTINGVNQGTFAAPAATPFARLEAHGLAGDDTITVSSTIALPAWLYGEDGNDHLTGGSGPSVLLGGNGNDTLTGGSGRDLLLGGQGADTLDGRRSGNNILIAGYTAFDDNQAALMAVLQEWTSSRDYATRVKDLTRSCLANRKSLKFLGFT